MTAPSVFQRSATRRSAVALSAAIGLVACLTYLAAAGLGVGPSETDHAYSLSDPPWWQAMQPALDVPIGAPWSASTLAARFSTVIAKGRRTARHDLAAVATALGVVLFGIALLEAGVATFPVLLTMVAMIVSPVFWSRGVAWTNDALSPALAMMAIWAGWRWLGNGRRAWLITAVIGGALAIAEDSGWVVLLPAVALICATRLPSSRRVHVGLVVTALAACGAWPFIMRAMMAGQLEGALMTGRTPGPFDLWRVAAFGVDSVSRVAAVRISLPADFTLVGSILAALGVAVLVDGRATRYATVATLAALLGWFWIAPRPDFQSLTVPLATSGWAAVAIGLAFFYRTAVGPMGPIGVLIAALVMLSPPALARARAMATTVPASDSDLRYRLAYDTRIADLPAGAILVAETRRIDATMLLAARQSGRALAIVPQSIEHLAAAAATGRPVIAMAGARANLERAGFVFDRGWLGNMPLHMVGGRARCVELKQDGPVDVSFQSAGGSFSLHGAAAGSPPGPVLVGLTGLTRIPVASTEPRRLRFEITSPIGAPEIALRIARTRAPAAVVINLTGAPATAWATAESAIPVTMCPGPQRADLMLSGRDAAQTLIDIRQASPFSSGWHLPEADPDPFRWTAASRSTMAITMAAAGPVRVTITATPAARPQQQPSIALEVNGCVMPSQVMPPGQGDYIWDVKAECWLPGINQMTIVEGPLVSPSDFGSPDQRRMGARVGAIRLLRLPRDQNAK